MAVRLLLGGALDTVASTSTSLSPSPSPPSPVPRFASSVASPLFPRAPPSPSLLGPLAISPLLRIAPPFDSVDASRVTYADALMRPPPGYGTLRPRAGEMHTRKRAQPRKRMAPIYLGALDGIYPVRQSKRSSVSLSLLLIHLSLSCTSSACAAVAAACRQSHHRRGATPAGCPTAASPPRTTRGRTRSPTPRGATTRWRSSPPVQARASVVQALRVERQVQALLAGGEGVLSSSRIRGPRISL